MSRSFIIPPQSPCGGSIIFWGMGQGPIKTSHAGALMPSAYLNERATRRSGCILPSGALDLWSLATNGTQERLGWGNVSFSSFLCAREKDRYFGSFYKRASFWRNRKKMNKRGCGGTPCNQINNDFPPKYLHFSNNHRIFAA